MDIAAIGHRALAWCSALVFTDTCPTCAGTPDDLMTAPICRACWSAMARYTGPACEVCARPFASPLSTICGECLKKPPPFVRAQSYTLYGETMKEAIHLLKYSRIKRLARPLAARLVGLSLPEVDAVIPVPIGLGGLRERGFNQTLQIGRVVARHLGVPMIADVLYRKRETARQAGLTRTQRIANLRGAFGTRGPLPARRVLLVDDVITTGTTASECAKALRKAGAAEIHVVTLARTY